MDPVTHILLGASLGYATFGGRLGRQAALAGGLAAFAPDVDVFIRSASDPLLAIEHHRGFTHSFTFAPAGAAVVASLWLLAPAWRSRWLAVWAACVVGYFSHALLDAATTYGTRLWWPWSRHRASWDLISIIDPVFTLVLALALAWALLRQRRAAVLGGLAFAAGYVALGAVQHQRAVDAQVALASARGHQIERFAVMPTLANNVVWRALYLNDGKIHSDRLRVGWFSGPTVREGWSLPLVRAADLRPNETRRNERGAFDRFAWFSDDWVGRSPHDPSVLADMRYSLSAEAFDPIWGIRYTEPGAPTDVVWVNRSRERQVRPGELWAEITGQDLRYRPLPARKP